MSAEGQTIREALRHYGTWRMQQPRRARAELALTVLEARLAEAERALRDISEMEEEDYSVLQIGNFARARLPSESETLTTKGTQ